MTRNLLSILQKRLIHTYIGAILNYFSFIIRPFTFENTTISLSKLWYVDLEMKLEVQTRSFWGSGGPKPELW